MLWRNGFDVLIYGQIIKEHASNADSDNHLRTDLLPFGHLSVKPVIGYVLFTPCMEKLSCSSYRLLLNFLNQF